MLSKFSNILISSLEEFLKCLENDLSKIQVIIFNHFLQTTIKHRDISSGFKYLGLYLSWKLQEALDSACLLLHCLLLKIIKVAFVMDAWTVLHANWRLPSMLVRKKIQKRETFNIASE